MIFLNLFDLFESKKPDWDTVCVLCTSSNNGRVCAITRLVSYCVILVLPFLQIIEQADCITDQIIGVDFIFCLILM